MEKRECQRFDCQAPIICGLFNSNQACRAEMVNCSSEGMCFKSDAFFKERSTILFRMSGPPRTAEDSKDLEGLRSISLAEVRWLKESVGKGDLPFYIGVKYY
jgi:hypothetical protein